MGSRQFISFLLIFGLSLLLAGCGTGTSDENEIIIFHAGSLSVPLKEIAMKYRQENPGVNIRMEGAGSVACARKITELNKKCDIMASADHKIIEEMLMPEYTEWNIWFATNEMVIAYSSKSLRKDELNITNWHSILSDKSVIFGRADPNADPCGYRTVMMFKLAELYYGISGLAEQLLVKDLNMIRPKGVDLVALLETNALDYIIEYKSVAEQHGLQYLELPNEVNLSDPEHEKLYNSVSVEIKGHSPTEFISIIASNMVYGITILDNAPNREEAFRFLKFLLGEEGSAIMEKNGQESIPLSVFGDKTKLPDNLLDII